jgi:hypothetical protein
MRLSGGGEGVECLWANEMEYGACTIRMRKGTISISAVGEDC